MNGTKTLLKLCPLLVPYAALFCGGVLLTISQSFGLLTPIPYDGGRFEAYTELLASSSFYASFLFSMQVGGLSALCAVIVGTLLAYGVWKLPAKLQAAALIYKIPLILPHIAVAFVVLLLWSRSGILASIAHTVGLIDSMREFPNVLYSGWGLGMILAYALKGTPFAMLLVMALLLHFDSRQIQTAEMLGATKRTVFFRIVLPRVAPAMHTAFIILFLYGFGAFDIPYVLSESRPGMLSIHVYNLYFKRDLANRPEAMAILVIMFCFAVLFIMAYSVVVRRLESAERKV
ncbi:MAG: ABC transporter permease subunit [Desulfobacteraceae bacterium]|jgi:putative spermidine/putrescine transport system permease protein